MKQTIDYKKQLKTPLGSIKESVRDDFTGYLCFPRVNPADYKSLLWQRGLCWG